MSEKVGASMSHFISNQKNVCHLAVQLHLISKVQCESFNDGIEAASVKDIPVFESFIPEVLRDDKIGRSSMASK